MIKIQPGVGDRMVAHLAERKANPTAGIDPAADQQFAMIGLIAKELITAVNAELVDAIDMIGELQDRVGMLESTVAGLVARLDEAQQ